MDRHPEITERFARETAEHKMTVLRDDGIYRHLRFIGPKTSAYWFELVTWPNSLAFRGDGDSFIFSRVEDMFMFFRDGARYGINPHYWGEKITDGRERIEQYSKERFDRVVAEALTEAEADYPGVTKAWAGRIDDEFNTEYEDEARRALDEFRFGTAYKVSCSCSETRGFSEDYEAAIWRKTHVAGLGHTTTTEAGDVFRFYDTWEWDLRDYHWWFLWVCTAIVWGIGQYDASKATPLVEGGAVQS